MRTRSASAARRSTARRWPVPAPPQARQLTEFQVTGATEFRFYVDRALVGVAEGGVVRYTMVARSSSGTQRQLTKRALPDGEHRVYAVMTGGGWRLNRAAGGPWRRAGKMVLAPGYFCPQRVPIRNVGEGCARCRRRPHRSRAASAPILPLPLEQY